MVENANFNPANPLEAKSKFVNTICLHDAGDSVTYHFFRVFFHSR